MSDREPLPTTAACADACVQLGVDMLMGPLGLLPIQRDWHLLGPARPVLHLGSVDVFLEACEEMDPGDVLLVDDRGRTDRACVGDLTASEVKGAGGAAPSDAAPRLGERTVEAGDVIVADADGVLLLPGDRADHIVKAALEIARTEDRQAAQVREGRSLREQLDFVEYLDRRRKDAAYTFREHLQRRGGAIER